MCLITKVASLWGRRFSVVLARKTVEDLRLGTLFPLSRLKHQDSTQHRTQTGSSLALARRLPLIRLQSSLRGVELRFRTVRMCTLTEVCRPPSRTQMLTWRLSEDQWGMVARCSLRWAGTKSSSELSIPHKISALTLLRDRCLRSKTAMTRSTHLYSLWLARVI